MDHTGRDFYVMILYNYKKELTADKCFTNLTEAFGGSVPFSATVGNWFKAFRMGRQSLEGEPCAGRSHTAVMDGNVGAVRKLITEDPRIINREREATPEVRPTAINTILYE